MLLPAQVGKNFVFLEQDLGRGLSPVTWSGCVGDHLQGYTTFLKLVARMRPPWPPSHPLAESNLADCWPVLRNKMLCILVLPLVLWAIGQNCQST